MNFHEILEETETGWTRNPFAGKTVDGEWLEGVTSLDFLNKHFGHLSTADEMIAATKSEGLQMFFKWLRDEQGILN